MDADEQAALRRAFLMTLAGALIGVSLRSIEPHVYAEPTPTAWATSTPLPTLMPTLTATPEPTATKLPAATLPATPTELPLAGELLPNDPYKPWEWSPEYWRIEGFENVIMTHNGSTSGFGDEIVLLRRGQIYSFGISDFEVLGVLRLDPRDVWALEVANRFDLSIMTCSGYVPTGGFWRYRVFVFLRELRPSS